MKDSVKEGAFTSTSSTIVPFSSPRSSSANTIHVDRHLMIDLPILFAHGSNAIHHLGDVGEGIFRLAVVPGAITTYDDPTMLPVRNLLRPNFTGADNVGRRHLLHGTGLRVGGAPDAVHPPFSTTLIELLPVPGLAQLGDSH
jgi:hypothetical protein